MAGQVLASTPEELHRAMQDIKCQLSRLDVMLADCYAERPRLIRQLRQLFAQRCNAKEAASSIAEPLLG